jgi:hypothetical protein
MRLRVAALNKVFIGVLLCDVRDMSGRRIMPGPPNENPPEKVPLQLEPTKASTVRALPSQFSEKEEKPP